MRAVTVICWLQTAILLKNLMSDSDMHWLTSNATMRQFAFFSAYSGRTDCKTISA